MDRRICSRQRPPALMRRAAFPVGDDTPCGLDQGDGGLNVIGLKPRFDHQINLTRRQKELLEEFEKEEAENSPENSDFFTKVRDFWDSMRK